MKTVPAVLLAVLLTSAPAPAPAQSVSLYRGEYLGIALPAGKLCSTERRTVSLSVSETGEMTGGIFDFDGNRLATIDRRISLDGSFNVTTGTNYGLPLPDCFPNCPDAGAGWSLKGKANARAGTIRGTVDGTLRGDCRYSFVLYRRFRNN